MTNGGFKLACVFVVVAGWPTPTFARRQVQLMPREETTVSADREPSESYPYTRSYEDSYRRRNSTSRFVLGGGLTSGVNQPITTETVSHSLYVAAGGESHQGYLGGDLDLFFDMGSIYQGNALNNAYNYQTGSLQQFGGLFDMTLDVPLDLGGFLVVPRAGVGYGIQHLALDRNFNTTAGAFSPASNGTKETVHGAFAMAGIIISPIKMLTFSADYASSFFSTGTVGGNSAPDIPLNNGGSSFDRIRATAFVRISHGISLGAQFVQRRIFVNFPVPNDPSGILAPKQQHFLGLLGLEL